MKQIKTGMNQIQDPVDYKCSVIRAWFWIKEGKGWQLIHVFVFLYTEDINPVQETHQYVKSLLGLDSGH